MPLYIFKCDDCDKTKEIFEHKILDDDAEIECEHCNGKCHKAYGRYGARKRMSSEELLEEKILPDAERIMEKVSKGSDSDFLDICGEK